jgi:hypothetical protein
MNERELLKQLIDALDKELPHKMQHIAAGQRFNARAALAQPEHEPVAWGNFKEDGTLVGLSQHPEDQANWMGRKPLYTTPPQRTWVGLTDEEIAEIEDGYIVDYRIPAGCGWNFAKDIEAKLKQKNT